MAEDYDGGVIDWQEELASMDDLDSATTANEVIAMANETVKGIIEKVNQNKGGFYAFLIADEWYGLGKNRPDQKEGDEVEFAITRNGRFKNVDGPVTVVSSGGPVAVASSGGEGKPDEAYWNDKDKRIALSGCRNSAIELVSVLLSNDALAVPAKKDRYDFVSGLVDEITDRYFNNMYGESYTQSYLEQ